MKTSAILISSLLLIVTSVVPLNAGTSTRITAHRLSADTAAVSNALGNPVRTPSPVLGGRIRHGLRPPWMNVGSDDRARAGYTYVGQEAAQNYSQIAINEYLSDNARNGGPVCQIPVPYGFPEGMTVDATGNLFVALHLKSTFGVGTFGPNCGKPGPTFTESSGLPEQPAVDGSVLYLTNLINTGESPATIEVYNLLLGPDPLQQLSNPTVVTGIGLAVDAHHNLFWASTHELWSKGEVVEFPGGKMPGKVIIRIGADFPGGVLFDRNENLVLVDQTARLVYVYPPPYTSKPVSTIPLKGTAVFCAMGLQQQRLYCLDYEFGAVDVYAYPTGKYIYSYTNGIDSLYDPIGIAVHR